MYRITIRIAAKRKWDTPGKKARLFIFGSQQVPTWLLSCFSCFPFSCWSCAAAVGRCLRLSNDDEQKSAVSLSHFTLLHFILITTRMCYNLHISHVCFFPWHQTAQHHQKPKDWLTPRPADQLLLVIAASFCGVLPGPSYLVRSAEQLMLYAFSRSVCPSVHSYVANIGWMLHTNAWYEFFLSCLSVCLSQNKECPVKAKSWTHTQNFILRNYVGILAQMLLLLLLLLL